MKEKLKRKKRQIKTMAEWIQKEIGELQTEGFSKYTRDELTEALRKAGMSKAPNVIPPAEASHDDPPRKVQIGSHPVLGAVGTYLSSLYHDAAAREEQAPPDPTFHWGVLVGDFFHELYGEPTSTGPIGMLILYQNGRPLPEHKWERIDVGETRFNDEAIRLAGEEVIKGMNRDYNLFHNNCQNFAAKLVEVIVSKSTSAEGEAMSEEGHKQSAKHDAEALMNKNTPRLSGVVEGENGEGKVQIPKTIADIIDKYKF